MNKTLIAIILLVATSLLAGCEVNKPPHFDINKTYIITDVQVVKTDSGGSKYLWYQVWFKKEGSDTLFESYVKKEIYIDIQNVLKTAKFINKPEEAYFDIVTDGNRIYNVTLSSNRK